MKIEDIEIKEDSAEKLNAVVGNPTKYYLFANEWNAVVEAIKQLKKCCKCNCANIGSGSGSGSSGVGNGVVDAWANAHYFPIGVNNSLFGGATMGAYTRVAFVNGDVKGELSYSGMIPSLVSIAVKLYSGSTYNLEGVVNNGVITFGNGLGGVTSQEGLNNIEEINVIISSYVANGITYTNGQFLWKRQVFTNKTPLAGYVNNSGKDFTKVIFFQVGETSRPRLYLENDFNTFAGELLGGFVHVYADGSTTSTTTSLFSTFPSAGAFGMTYIGLTIPTRLWSYVVFSFTNFQLDGGTINGQLRFE